MAISTKRNMTSPLDVTVVCPYCHQMSYLEETLTSDSESSCYFCGKTFKIVDSGNSFQKANYRKLE